MTTAAVSYEVRYRESGTEQWSDIITFKVGAALVINVIDTGKDYEAEARGVSRCGARSAWGTATVTVDNVNQRVNQGNLNTLTVAGIRSAWLGADITYDATPTSATINVTAGTLKDGDANPAYAASAATVSGSAGTTVGYWLYYDDPAGNGGSFALGTTTDYTDLSDNQGRIWVGQVSVAFPTSGSGSGGGSGGGGGPCVDVDSFVLAMRQGVARWMRAGDVQVGDELRLLNPGTLMQRWGLVTHSQPNWSPRVRFTDSHGLSLTCSTTAPIGCEGGATVLAPDLLGRTVPSVVDGQNQAGEVVAVEPMPDGWVQHITCENDFFLSSDRAGAGFAHHNLKQIPEP